MSLRYQWYKDGVAINGATSSTYSKLSSVNSDAGTYYCIISNDNGSIQSNSCTVSFELEIVTQPSWGTVIEGSSASVSITAFGAGTITYQWYKDGSIISGATSNTYTISSVARSDSGIYYCIASVTGKSITSDNATLIVNFYFSVLELCSLSNTPYFLDSTSSVIADSISETVSTESHPYLTDVESSVIADENTETLNSATIPYFIDEESAS